MPKRQNIKVAPELHREIDIESAQSGIPIYKLVELAWESYSKHTSVSEHTVNHEKNNEQAHSSSVRWGYPPEKLSMEDRTILAAVADMLADSSGDVEFAVAAIRAAANAYRIRQRRKSGKANTDKGPQQPPTEIKARSAG